MSNLMNSGFNLKLVVSGSLLKIITAIFQFLTSVLYLRYLGAVEYGKILSVVAFSEILLLVALPGIQKTCIKLLAKERFPLDAYLLKLICVCFVAVVLNFQQEELFYFSIALLICLDHLFALNRASLHVNKKFNLLVLLDTIRSGLSVLILTFAISLQLGVSKEIFLWVLSLGIGIEFIICFPYVLSTFRVHAMNPLNLSALFANSLLASGFTYSNTILRRLPIVIAGTFAAELSALVAIFLQFFTLLNYLISVFMLQISLQLLNKELVLGNVVDGLKKYIDARTIYVCLAYTLILIVVDISKNFWLPVIFNYQSKNIFSILFFLLMPFVALFSQIQFYNLFSKSNVISNIFIILNILMSISIGAVFYYFGISNFISFEVGVIMFQSSILMVLILSDIAYGRIISR